MIRHKQVKLNLRSLLLDVTGLPADRQYENVDFETPSGDEATDPKKWLREKYLAGEDVRRAKNRLVCNGIYAIDLFAPRGTGSEEIEDLADDIKAKFKPSTTLSNPEIVIVRSYRLDGRPDGDWFMLPVRISFRTFANNQ